MNGPLPLSRNPRRRFHYIPPAFFFNPKNDILYVNGRTGRFLEPALGLGGMNVVDMAREELNLELNRAVYQAVAISPPVLAEYVKLRLGTGAT